MIRLITTVLLLQLVQVFSFAQESIEKRVSLATEYLTIITTGGIVANDFQIISHSHQVGELQEGIFGSM